MSNDPDWSGCHITFYCSRECQKLHWKLHKSQCCAYKVNKQPCVQLITSWLQNHIPGVQLPLSGPLPGGHQGLKARGDDHLRSVFTILRRLRVLLANRQGIFSRGLLIMTSFHHCRDSPGDWSPGRDSASLPRLLQASHQQICVSGEIMCFDS